MPGKLTPEDGLARAVAMAGSAVGTMALLLERRTLGPKKADQLAVMLEEAAHTLKRINFGERD